MKAVNEMSAFLKAGNHARAARVTSMSSMVKRCSRPNGLSVIQTPGHNIQIISTILDQPMLAVK